MFPTDETLAQLKVLDALAEAIGGVFPVVESDLQPTSRACKLAALAALSVLNAHELGQTGTPPGAADTPRAPRVGATGHTPRHVAHKKSPKATAPAACEYCGKKFLARGLKKHVRTCPQRPNAA